MRRIGVGIVILGLAVMSAAPRAAAAPELDCAAEAPDAAGGASSGAQCAHCKCAGSTKMKSMPMGDDDGNHGAMMDMHPKTFLQEIVHHATSGTSAEPNSTPTPMLMTMDRGWMLMFHANAFAVDIQQSSPRGGDKFFSTNWFMGMAEHPAGNGVFTARVMLSLEPATITDRRYPLLFQQGETAYGVPIADGQHPHNLFMELGLLYDWKLGEKSLLSFISRRSAIRPSGLRRIHTARRLPKIRWARWGIIRKIPRTFPTTW
jgi:hypothetical protein